jgi:hypothetical protein
MTSKTTISSRFTSSPVSHRPSAGARVYAVSPPPRIKLLTKQTGRFENKLYRGGDFLSKVPRAPAYDRGSETSHPTGHRKKSPPSEPGYTLREDASLVPRREAATSPGPVCSPRGRSQKKGGLSYKIFL